MGVLVHTFLLLCALCIGDSFLVPNRHLGGRKLVRGPQGSGFFYNYVAIVIFP